MPTDDPMFQRSVYAVLIPGGVGLVLAAIALLIRKPRPAAFATPVAPSRSTRRLSRDRSTRPGRGGCG